jgi:hypothetical protein
MDDLGLIPGRSKRFISSARHKGVIYPRAEQLGRESDHSPLFRANIKNSAAIPSLSHVSMVWCLIKYRDVTMLPFIYPT